MKSIRVRLAFDLVLGLLIAFEMLYTLTGNACHEIMGVVFYACVCAHLVFTRKWSASMAKSISARQKPTADQVARLVLAIMLALCGIVLGASSVAISNLLGMDGATLASGTYLAWSLVHTVSAYALCVIATVHLLLHWVFVAKALRINYDPERRQAINATVGAAAGIAAVAIGVVGVGAVRSFALPIEADGLDDGSESGSNDEGAPSQGGEVESPRAEGGESGGRGSEDGGRSGSSSAEDGSGSLEGEERSGRRQRRGDSNGGSSGEGSQGESQAQPQSPRSEAPQGGESDGEGSSQDGGSSTSGICTLCRKYCPLSAPKCNKPYAAGLI